MLSARTGRSITALLMLSLASTMPIAAQTRRSSSPTDPLIHVYAVVPMVGAGTMADPKRPMFAPQEGVRPTVTPGPIGAGASGASRSGIVGYHAQISDDGNFAVVEFLAASRTDLLPVLSTTDSRVQVFVKGVDGKDKIVAAFRIQCKNFAFENFLSIGVH